MVAVSTLVSLRSLRIRCIPCSADRALGRRRGPGRNHAVLPLLLVVAGEVEAVEAVVVGHLSGNCAGSCPDNPSNDPSTTIGRVCVCVCVFVFEFVFLGDMVC